jgi:hypothetical protein
MAGELMLAEQTLRNGNESRADIADDFESDATQDPLDRLVNTLSGQNHRRLQLGDVADYYLATAEGFEVPVRDYEAASRKLRSKYERVSAGWDVDKYALRVGSAEGMRRAALLTAELRSQSIPIAGLPGKLAESPLRNPYNGQPFDWDAADQAIVFIGPETRKYRRQAYPY